MGVDVYRVIHRIARVTNRLSTETVDKVALFAYSLWITQGVDSSGLINTSPRRNL
jgi:hypothetical protein